MVGDVYIIQYNLCKLLRSLGDYETTVQSHSVYGTRVHTTQTVHTIQSGIDQGY